jgi:hypothetical protein
MPTEIMGTLVTLPLRSSSRILCKMLEFQQFTGLDSPGATVGEICVAVARIFRVRETEVALLELCGTLLNFVYPAELKTAGAIPLSSSAVAARTARTREAELSNGFTQVKHFSIFELVKLGDTGLDAQVIQKMMSAPVVARDGKVIGVIQISRKAPRLEAAGPDFTPEDLEKLQAVGCFLGTLIGNAKLAASAGAR